ncbi:MAG: hypothetical protein JKY04_05860 [Sneathiella sp.]|nr:hypothetical protein [Sneathiella sp.]
MKTDLGQTWIRQAFSGPVVRILHKAVIAAADIIGFCVAEIRFHIIPYIQKIPSSVFFRSTGECRLEPSFVTVSKHVKDKISLPESVREEILPFDGDTYEEHLLGKKYTYAWAVEKIAELEKSGISDPVTYFNNEMTDWWLAPDGMMEEEADFVGIAHAIEERWHM